MVKMTYEQENLAKSLFYLICLVSSSNVKVPRPVIVKHVWHILGTDKVTLRKADMLVSARDIEDFFKILASPDQKPLPIPEPRNYFAK